MCRHFNTSERILITQASYSKILVISDEGGSLSSNSGMSLLSVIVAVGLLGVVAAGIARLSKSSNQAMKYQEMRQDRIHLKQALIRSVDCNSTGLTCPTNGAIQIMDKEGNELIASNDTGTKIGKWTIRARCIGGEAFLQSPTLLPTGELVAPWKNLFDPQTARFAICGPGAAASSSVSALCVPSTVFSCVDADNFKRITGDLVLQVPPDTDCGKPFTHGGENFRKVHSMATINCPDGFRAVSGGANCEHSYGTADVKHGSYTGNTVGGGNLLAQFPTFDGKGWTNDCCAIVHEDIAVTGHSDSGKGMAFVHCLPE